MPVSLVVLLCLLSMSWIGNKEDACPRRGGRGLGLKGEAEVRYPWWVR